MNTLKVIERIQSLYSKGVASDGTPLSSRHIYNKLMTVRQRLIAQQIKKRQKVSDWNYTVLPCVELIRVPNHECSCLADLGCDVYRTKYPLPKILTDLNRHMIDYVMSIENGMRFDATDRTSVLYLKGNKYTSTKVKYLLENSHLYFPLPESPGVVKIKLLAEDPVEASKYPSLCPCENCEDCKEYADVEFPIDGDMLELVITMSAGELLGSSPQQEQQNEGQ